MGQAGEGYIARWLRSRGTTVLPVYEKVLDTGKGPQVFLPTESLVAPDFLCWNDSGVFWIEAKHKSAFSWHRNTQRWVTGIDLRHYIDYLRIDSESPFPVWLLFLHEDGTAKDSPLGCPTGLFGNTLAYLHANENHRHANWGTSGMVYWSVDSLRLLVP